VSDRSIEICAQLGANCLDGRDNENRNAPSNQSIFDCSCRRVRAQEMQNKLSHRTLRWWPLPYRKPNRDDVVFDRCCPRLILEERPNPGHPTHSMWPDTTTRYRRAVNKSSLQSPQNSDGIKWIFHEGPAGLSRLVGMTEPMSRVASGKKPLSPTACWISAAYGDAIGGVPSCAMAVNGLPLQPTPGWYTARSKRVEQ
jgi:hypothetical protein